MKIAYIEDDKDSRDIFSRKLKQDGIECDVFDQAEQTQGFLQAGSYDLLLVDVRLPGQNGVDFLQSLRDKQIGIPCILITAFDSSEIAKSALNANANYLLEKPFSYQSLLKLIRNVTSRPFSLSHCVDRGLSKLGLTARETELARWLLKGLSNYEIAEVAGLSEKTVKQHISQIFEKADVKSRGEFFSWIFPV